MGERESGQKTFVCSYFDCRASFNKSWKLDAHLCKHEGLKPFSCENCDQSFCTRHQLTRHELSHSGEKPHKCPTDGCSEAFQTKASLRHHMARVHQHQEKQYKVCDKPGCGKDFNKRNQLKAHRCEQHEEPPAFLFLSSTGYPCGSEGCSSQGKTWTEILKHRKQHKVKVPCGQCQKLFSNAWFLHQHELRVHSGQPRRMFSCPKEGCEKKFSRSLNLESHVLGDHEGKKAFSCAYDGCGKSFAVKESLWRHGVVHNTVKKKLKVWTLKSKQNQMF
uniref:Transcription factor IIIA n=1 Tax=Gouania willdenowi TaxID=441366 RepID=A0A8C5N6F8_GOUWI